MMKKLIALFVGLMFALSLGVAYADEEAPNAWQQNTQSTTAPAKKKNVVKQKVNKKEKKKADKQKAEKKEAAAKKTWKFWE